MMIISYSLLELYKYTVYIYVHSGLGAGLVAVFKVHEVQPARSASVALFLPRLF